MLYLDSDLIVTNSLRSLWRSDLSGHGVAAVTTVFPAREWGERHCAAIGLGSPDLYFNAGVLLMNLHELRRDDCASLIREYALTHADPQMPEDAESSPSQVIRYIRDHPDRLVFEDQDAMNAVLASRRRRLHPRSNCMRQIGIYPWSRSVFGEEAVDEALPNPAIRHYEGYGKSKPCQPDAEPELAGLYWMHRDQTPWPGRGSVAFGG